MAKQLKSSTIKSYQLEQIVKHAERFNSPYRFSLNHHYVIVFEYDKTSNAYFHIGSYDKQCFVNEILFNIYTAQN